MAKHLRQFYVALRRQDGRQYSKSSYINIRAAVNRHLQSPPNSRQINIAHDRPFMSANHVFVGLLKDLKARGLETTHKTAISSEDMRKLYASGNLSEDNPRSLQRKVFVELMLHFGRRGREGLRDMGKDSIVIKVDGSGKSYATTAYNELSKNHQNVLTDKAHDEKQSMMMEQPQRCPVQSLRLYMSKLNDRCDAFWQRPNEKYEGRNWYANRAVGVNTLADMMKVISQEAHLSFTYTNHWLWATSCTVLSDGGIHARHICKLTGHRNESSVAVYVRATPIEKRREMSELLHSYGAPQTKWCPCPNQHSSHRDNCDPGANYCDVCRLCSFHCQCSNCECRAYCECRTACNECLLQLLGTWQFPLWSQLLWVRNVQLGTWHPWERLLNSYAMQILSVHCSNKISSLFAHNAHTRLQICAPCFEHHNTHCSVPHVVI